MWAGDSLELFGELDVFFQVYDAAGHPISSETRANELADDFQDRPAVRFLPEADGEGNPQFVITWRDVGIVDGSQPRGTGISYRCYSIVSENNPDIFFEHGFETGDGNP